jgi:hypothetical protein
MRPLLFTGILLLAACGGRSPAPPPEEPPSADTIACRTEARNSPGRSRIMQQWNPGYAANEARINAELEALERRSFLDCMRRRGAIPQSGGVEAPRR